jgi:nucleotide-binding universal stress UspA family protein
MPLAGIATTQPSRIVAEAEGWGADLIIVGSHSPSKGIVMSGWRPLIKGYFAVAR